MLDSYLSELRQEIESLSHKDRYTFANNLINEYLKDKSIPIEAIEHLGNALYILGDERLIIDLKQTGIEKILQAERIIYDLQNKNEKLQKR